MCNQGDIILIDLIKKIPYATMDVELVHIGPESISRKYLESLFQPSSYLGDEVIYLFGTRTPKSMCLN